MLRISLPWIIDAAEALERLTLLVPSMNISQTFGHLYGAQRQIDALLIDSVYSPYLRASRQKGNELKLEIDKLLKKELEYSINEYEVYSIKNLRDQFKLIFISEIGTLPVFIVSPKESYDTGLLIDAGTSLFPGSMIGKAPETERDALEVGKALAFELGTACGFHAFRVTESVVKRYWDEVSGQKKRPNLQTLGNFASELEKGKFGEAKVFESIKQLAKLHRNPTIHPEVILSVDEAIGIVGMARSVIGSMLAVLPDIPVTTGAPSTVE